ncbi:MAG: flagellar biosynthesis anti-sigma factor FlgM [Sedimenticola sp.]
MSVRVGGVKGKSVSGASNGSKARAAAPEGLNASTESQRSETAGGGDRVSLTGTATRLQELEKHIASMPIVDVEHVSHVQHSLAGGSYLFEPVEAADNLLTQERNFALISRQRQG